MNSRRKGFSAREVIMSNPGNLLSLMVDDEMSALNTYDRLIHRLQPGQLKSTLQQYRDTHERRLAKMRQRLGVNTPSVAADPWSSFAGPMGDYEMLAILEKGERHVLDDYSTISQS